MKDLLGACSQQREGDVQCSGKSTIQGSPLSAGALRLKPHSSTSAPGQRFALNSGQARGTPSSLSRGGVESDAHRSPARPLPHWASTWEEKRKSWLFCLLSCASPLLEYPWEALRGPRDRRSRVLGAHRHESCPGNTRSWWPSLTVLSLRLGSVTHWLRCAGPSALTCPSRSWEDHCFSLVAIQLLSVWSPLIHSLQ